MKKYVVSTTLKAMDWNSELLRGNLAEEIQRLKRESSKGLFVGGVQLPLALAELGLIDESMNLSCNPFSPGTGRRHSQGCRSS